MLGVSYAEWGRCLGRSAVFFMNSWTYLVGVKAGKTEKLSVIPHKDLGGE